jgi:hypothetical protein
MALYPSPILIGCSAWAFDDWVGTFYPQGMRPADFLPYYADRFRAAQDDAVRLTRAHGMTGEPSDTDQDWSERELYWRSKLRRLRFGVEPLRVQVEKYCRVTITLSSVCVIIAVMFLTIFAAFGRPDVGLVVVLVLFVPIVGLAWLDYWKLAARVAAYEAEKKAEDQARVPADSG